ncbi:histidine-type phosphatase [Niveibacterium terrae]|uniref:histidine-type phosphatase n=1 Tax=Niveibacterium terrae TaxID=3373598 RepID=UPI003A8FFD70
MKTLTRLLALPIACSALLAACGGDNNDAASTPSQSGYYASKTNYQPQQAASTYEATPAGFAPVYTELVARHSTRGLSGMKYDDAVLNMWTQAKADGALTALGDKLGPDVEKIMKANFLLGYGVAGISTAGYGNLTQVGINEHKQLATRLYSRLPTLFSSVGTRKIEIMNSGQDRAVDSSQFFANSLGSNGTLAANITPAGINRYQLYFHKLSATGDKVTDGSAINAQVLQASLDYQSFAAAKDATGYGTEVAAKIAAARATPEIKTAARVVLEKLFSKAFLDKIDAGTYKFSNNSTRSYTSDDGKFTNKLTGDGKTKILSSVDAAALIYELYIIAPGLKNETGVDFSPYMPSDQAKAFAYLQDIDDFYNKGPSATEYSGVTYTIAAGLLLDFFAEVDHIAAGDTTRAARLRFTHAEVMAPFTAIMGIPGASSSVPRAQTYGYDNNAWRGESVIPMTANVQWDIYRNANGTLLVRMLFNEKEVDFKKDCDSARNAPGSKYYSYTKLKACYYPAG